MKIIYFFLLNIFLSIMLVYAGYYLFQTYALALDAIVNPTCPATSCICEACKYKEDAFDCEYDLVCNALGHCEACPLTYKEEYEQCQELLKLESRIEN